MHPGRTARCRSVPLAWGSSVNRSGNFHCGTGKEGPEVQVSLRSPLKSYFWGVLIWDSQNVVLGNTAVVDWALFIITWVHRLLECSIFTPLYATGTLLLCTVVTLTINFHLWSFLGLTAPLVDLAHKIAWWHLERCQYVKVYLHTEEQRSRAVSFPHPLVQGWMCGHTNISLALLAGCSCHFVLVMRAG